MPDSLNQSQKLEHKPWFKLWSKEWLHGSLRFDCSPEERSIWADLLSLANENRNRGFIQANNDKPYPHSWIANLLNIRVELLDVCLKKFTEQGRIIENGHGIEIINFQFYQGQNEGRMGRPSKYHKGAEPQIEGDDNPDKYTSGKYGHLVQK